MSKAGGMLRSLLKRAVFLLLALLGTLALLRCPILKVEKELPMESIRIVEAYPDRAFYRPGEKVRLLVYLTSELSRPVAIRLRATICFLVSEVCRIEHVITVQPGDQWHELLWDPPPQHPTGYGVDLQVLDRQGTTLSMASTSFDVLERWTQAPRYGFLTDFSPGRMQVEETMDWLIRYHINGLQFYDWMYRHEELLTSQEPYRDPLGRLLSRRTVEALIDAAHRRNIAAMPYTAIYGASVSFYKTHPDWALYKAGGRPIPFGENFLYIMDPSPDSPWTEHLLSEFSEVMQGTKFDGIHLDQYGDPKSGFDAQGEPVNLAEAIPAFINLTKDVVTSYKADATVVFNAVNNWPIETVAPAKQDLVYIEVWPPHTLYQDLWKVIVNAQRLGGGKLVVLAAYVEPARHRNVRLTDAVIFASGGYHIELGERNGMLADPYFPKYQQMSNELAAVVRRYYDFAVRYENVLAEGTWDTTEQQGANVFIEGVQTDPRLVYKKVWAVTRAGPGFETISLINLLGIANPEWSGLLVSDPPMQENLCVRYYTAERIRRVWLASPDLEMPSAVLLSFECKQDARPYVEFKVPKLIYWDLLVVEYGA